MSRLVAFTIATTLAATSSAGTFIGSGSNNNRVMHAQGYTGSGGNLDVFVCIGPTVSMESNPPQPADMEVAVRNAVDRFNMLAPTTGNVRTGSDNELNSGELDWESALTHEIGHCIGLGHPNLGVQGGVSGSNTNFTATTSGTDTTFDFGIGTDGIRGSADDERGDDVNLHWFLIGENNPFRIVSPIDSSNYSRDLGDLPVDDLFATNADRTVSTNLFGLPSTEAVMQQGQGSNEDQRSLTGDDVATLAYARSGVDATAGTADDYTVTYFYDETGTNCDINVAFDDSETGFAVCQVSFNTVSGNNSRISAANTFYNAGANWVFTTRRIPFARPDALMVDTGGTTTQTTGGNSSLLTNDTDQEGDGLVMSTAASGGPESGSVVLNTNGTFSYTHDGTGTTEDFFIYRVCTDDGGGGETNSCSHQRVDVAINLVGNTAPTAVTDTATVEQGGMVSMLDGGAISLLANDTDAENDGLSLSMAVASPPDNGMVTLNPGTGGFSYSHDGSMTSSDSFQYEVCDDGSPSLCATGTVNISVNLAGGVLCSEPGFAIPDNSSAGVSDTIVNSSFNGPLQDLNVELVVDHTWVGDLVVTLNNSANLVTLVDRPGIPASAFGCGNDDIDVIIDDEGTGPIEDACSSAPAIGGTLTPSIPLSAFDATQYADSWTLTISDNEGNDTGTLVRWCLVPAIDSTDFLFANGFEGP